MDSFFITGKNVKYLRARNARVVRCVSCGNMTIDDLVFHDGTTRLGVPGGDAVYCAIGAAFWDVSVSLAAVAGPDYPVARLTEAHGIDISSVIRKTSPSLRNWGLYEQDGTRQFIFRNPKGQWEEYSPTPRDVPARLIKDAFFHCAPIPWEKQVDMLRHARQSGALFISVDPPYQSMDGIDSKELGRLLEHADAFLPSRQEARAMLPGLAPDEVLETIIGRYPALKVIVMKLGEDGAVGFEQKSGTRFRIPAFAADAVDPTGAGDSFCGGFMAGYALSGSARRAALHGAVSASFVVETVGTLDAAGVSAAAARQRLADLEARAASTPQQPETKGKER